MPNHLQKEYDNMLLEIYKIHSYAQISVAIEEYNQMNSRSVDLGYLLELIEEKSHALLIRMDLFRNHEWK